MLILAIDSSGSSCAVCVWKDGDVLAQKTETMERGQDARLVPMILETLDKVHLTFSDLDRIAVTCGPGSFTGIRVGLAAARGLGLAAQKPVLGINRFTAYHHLFKSPDTSLLVVLNSKRAELYCQFFPLNQNIPEPCLMTHEEALSFMKDHASTKMVGDMEYENDSIISTVAYLASRVDVKDPHYIARPFYMRPPDVSFSTKIA